MQPNTRARRVAAVGATLALSAAMVAPLTTASAAEDPPSGDQTTQAESIVEPDEATKATAEPTQKQEDLPQEASGEGSDHTVAPAKKEAAQAPQKPEPRQTTAKAATPQAAADPDHIADAIKTLTSTGEIKVGSTLRVDGTWSVPNGTPAGSTFSVDFPAELAPTVNNIPLLAPDGAVVATSTYANGKMTWTLTDFVTDRPNNVGGSFYFFIGVDRDAVGGEVEIECDDSKTHPIKVIERDGGTGPSNYDNGRKWAEMNGGRQGRPDSSGSLDRAISGRPATLWVCRRQRRATP